MKTPSTFWPLLKSELVLGRSTFSAFMLLLVAAWWMGVVAFAWVPLFGQSAGHGTLSIYFASGLLPLVACQLLGTICVWMAFATIPSLLQILPAGGAVPAEVPHLGGLEFMFTRAVNRGSLFRAKTTVFCLLVLTPFFLNVVVAPYAPKIHMVPPIKEQVGAGRDQAVAGDQIRIEKDIAAFARDQGDEPPKLAVTFFAWLAWGAASSALLLQCFGLLIARYVKPSNPWTALYALVPLLLVIRTTILETEFHQAGQLSIYENCFLVFATHPWSAIAGLAASALILQPWCERRFSRLEIL